MSSGNTDLTWYIALFSYLTLRWGAIRNGTPLSCPFCHVILLTGEKHGFCCGPNGNCFLAIPPLPALPQEFDTFINNPHISHLSRNLNLIFSFALLESSHAFPSPGAPCFLAIAGKTYHRICTQPMDNSAIRWMIYDGFNNNHIPHANLAQSIPTDWIDSLRISLLCINPLTQRLMSLHDLC
jgi:hypothetical protein